MTWVVDSVFVAQVVVLFTALATRLSGSAAAALAGWLALTAALAAAGSFLRGGALPPYYGLLLVTPIVAGVLYLRSPHGVVVLSSVPAAWPVALQSFRIVMELILWALYLQGRAPRLLTFEGRNVDIVVGLTALPVAYFCFVRRAWPARVAVVWNVAGLAILANVVVYAQLSAPGPVRMLFTDPPTTFIASWPYVWLPGFLVPVAVWLHVASLMKRRAATR